VATARRLTAVLRRTDTAARLGGDEFVVLLDGLGAVDEATVAADRVRAALAEPVDVAGQPVTVGVSIGIAHSGGGSLDPDELLRQADAGMYAAKSASRGERAAAAR